MEIRLKDLERDFYVSLTDSGDQKLKELIKCSSSSLKESEKSSFEIYLRGEKNTISALTLNSLSHLEGFSRLKDKISYVKAGKRGNRLNIDSFPIRPNTSDWGFIFGMLPDTSNDDYSIALQSSDLIEKLRVSLEKVGLDVKVRESDRGYELYGSTVLARLINKTGFTGSKRQVEENVCFPKWVYTKAEPDFHKALIAGIIESEGCAPTPSSRTCRVTQSRSFDSSQELDIDYSFETPTGNDVSIFVDDTARRDMEPPALLLSVKKLLDIYDIGSTIKLDSLYETERGAAARFNLFITGEDIRELFDFCSDHLVSKRNQFEHYFDQKQEKHRDKGTRIESYLEDIELLYKEHGYVTSKMLAEYADRETKTARNTLSILNNKGLIECEGLKNQYKCWKPVRN